MKHIIIILTMILSLTGCAAPPNKEPISETAIFFDTVVTIRLFDTRDKTIIDNCFKLCREYEDKFSRTIATSEISKINNGKSQPVAVSDETIELLKKGLYYSELSGGAFDITIAPLSELWDFKNNTGILPDEALIKDKLTHVNYKNIVIENNNVTLLDPLAHIDLGGIAKGYVADKLKAYLVKEGVKHGIIDLGGNVLTIGTKLNGENYNIGIQKPFDKQNTTITNVSVRDQSVVSSGVYERYFEVGDIVYHHILDPATGYPYRNNLLEVTIISDRSVDGDGLSTTCLALGLEKGLELINQTDNTEAIFITDDYQLHYSDNLRP